MAPDSDTLPDMAGTQPVLALAREHRAGHHTGRHSHPRGQLLYAAEGVMRARSSQGMWLIPPMRALWIPPDTEHEVSMLSPVRIRTLYIESTEVADFGPLCRVLEVSRLLKELILALIAEPSDYRRGDRGWLLAELILSEIARAPGVPIEIPWPRDRRLVAVCEAILSEPGRRRTLEEWADIAGASGRTLIRLFPRETGLQFRHWVQQVQLAEALCYLTRGESIELVAARLGYASPSAFSSMFRRILGAPPRQYLKHRGG